MKHKSFLYGFFMVLGLGVTLSISAQRRLTEATIAYDIIINSNDQQPRAADLLDGATSVIYIKGASSRTEMISSLGTQATIIDGKSGNVTILKDYGEQRYMIQMTAAQWKESNEKNEGVSFIYAEEFKIIAGHKCQKAIGKLADSSTFTVYFTRDLVPVNRDFQYMNKNLPGLAMQYEASVGNMLVTYTVASINFNPVQQKMFDIPQSGYRVMTYEESMNTKGKQ